MALTKWTSFTLAHSNEGARKIRRGLQARIQDPLFFLARQWQMGEFFGEDAGSPILTNVESESFPINFLYRGDQGISYNVQEIPLEVIVERESVEQVQPNIRARGQAGLLFFKLIEQAGLPCDRALLLTRFQFTEHEPTQDIGSKLIIQRAPDAQLMYSALTEDNLSDLFLSQLFPSANPDLYPDYRQIAAQWRQSYEQQVGKPEQGDAWLEQRLEYQFHLSVPTDLGQIELKADEYLGGRLDWDAFEITKVEPAKASVESIKKQDTLLPGPVTYFGMPSPRWWEFEDGRVDFGNPDGIDRDLGRLLLAEFAMNWGNDWFQVPLEIPTGCLCRVNKLLVTDTFGVTTRISPQSDNSPGWSMNCLSQNLGQAKVPALKQFLFIPPTLPLSLQAPPLEEVLFLRDEMANLAWAIEKILPDILGRPKETDFAESFLKIPKNDDGEPRYEVITDLPELWIPLVPVTDPDLNCRFLARAGLRDEINQIPPEPQGQLLSTKQAFRVYDQEIPREGVCLSRAWQLTRWYKGRRVVWVGRRKHTGVGEIRSNLEFDRLFNLGKHLPIQPQITQIVPSSGEQGQTLTVTISGKGLTGFRDIKFSGTGITARILPGGNSFSAIVELSIEPNAALGSQTFQITTPDGVADSEAQGLSFRITSPLSYMDDFDTSNLGIGGHLI